MNAETESREASGQALDGGLRYLAHAQRGSGGWPYRADLTEAALEPTVWALLSLRAHGRLGPDVAQRGLAYVRKTQRADCGFARSSADEAPADWHSFLGVFCLQCLSDAPEAVRRGLAWTPRLSYDALDQHQPRHRGTRSDARGLAVDPGNVWVG